MAYSLFEDPTMEPCSSAALLDKWRLRQSRSPTLAQDLEANQLTTQPTAGPTTASPLSEWLSSTGQETTGVGEDAEEGEPSCTPGGNASWCRTHGTCPMSTTESGGPLRPLQRGAAGRVFSATAPCLDTFFHPK